MQQAPARSALRVVWRAGCIGIILASAALPALSANALADQQSGWCKPLAARLPGVTRPICERSALERTGAVSRNGFPILARDFSPRSNEPNKEEPLRVLLLGGIHGDELTASAIVFHWMAWMNSVPANHFHWRVAPIVNPDGLLAPKPQRVNANGVDLNRNFPTPNWLKEAPRYWAKTTGRDPRRFPGPSPLSEPESLWLNQEIEHFKPDVIISVHAPFGVLDLDGPATPPRKFGRLWLNRVGVYPGSLGNYSGLHKNVPVLTIELPNALALPPKAEMQRIWQDMLQWIKQHVPNK